MRVATRPGDSRFTRLEHRGVRMDRREALPAYPGTLAPCSLDRFDVSGPFPNDPGPSGFTPPEAVHAKFVSPCRPGLSPLPATGLLQQGEFVPETSHATPAAAPPSRSFGRPRNLPPEGQDDYRMGFFGCGEVGGNPAGLRRLR